MASNLAFAHLTENLPLLGSLTVTVLPGGKPHTCRKGLREAGSHSRNWLQAPLCLLHLGPIQSPRPPQRASHTVFGVRCPTHCSLPEGSE